MSDGVAELAVDSSLTRTQSRTSDVPPFGSQGYVETNASRLSFQIASVGRRSTASTIVAGVSGWFGGGGSSNGGIPGRLFVIAIVVAPPFAGEPVIRA